MTGAKVLRRIASWLLFLAAATWFLVETIELATAPYLAAYDGEITDLFSRFYLPLLYVVHVKLYNKTELCYYPQALKPIITLEKISSENPEFSKLIEKHTKLDMKSRQIIVQYFLRDIGNLSLLNDLEFIPDYIDAEKIGYTKKKFECPTIICGNGRKLSYNKQSMVFGNGFYKQPEETVRFAYFYPKGKKDLMRSFAISLTDFFIKGQIFGDSKFMIPNLMTSELKTVCNQEYEIGDSINYKKLVRSLSDEKKFDVAIVLVPTEEDESNPYSTFKTAWAEKNIPSQMINIKTAEMFEKRDPNAKWFMQNIALGIFAKTGGIPWIVDNVPGNVDCFVVLMLQPWIKESIILPVLLYLTKTEDQSVFINQKKLKKVKK